MKLTNSVYILECISKKESLGEGAMLNEFLKIIMPRDRIKFIPIKSKDDFFNKLYKNNSKMVHISCHGDICIKVPRRGEINPEEFHKGVLKRRNVIITGCNLGKETFARKFLERTDANSLIAPLKEIDSFDVAMWCANFYHHLFDKKNIRFNKCYDYMKKNFYIKGAMKMWE